MGNGASALKNITPVKTVVTPAVKVSNTPSNAINALKSASKNVADLSSKMKAVVTAKPAVVTPISALRTFDESDDEDETIRPNSIANIANKGKPMTQLQKISNMIKSVKKEGFEDANPYIPCDTEALARKDAQLFTLVVVIIVLITAFILLGCYIFMRGGMVSTSSRVIDDNAYSP